VTVAQKLKLRLFLEGVEIPVIAAVVETKPNAPCVASIQIPPLPEGTRLHPRTLVHLFFLDFYEIASPLVSTTGANGTKVSTYGTVDANVWEQSLKNKASLDENGQIMIQNQKVLEDDFRASQYKLLFGGDLLGWDWTKTPHSRSLVLKCMDWSNYWDYAFQFKNTDVFGPGYKALFSGGGTNLFTDFLSSASETIINIINSPSVNYPKLKGMLGGIVHLLEAIGGSYYEGKKFAGQNTFFSLAELRLHITQMITAYEDDPTAKNLIRGGCDYLVGRELGNMGSQVSFRQTINSLQSKIFHETFGQPCPSYVPGTGSTISGYVRAPIRNDPDKAFVATTADTLVPQLQDLITAVSYTNVENPPTKSDILSRIAAVRKTIAVTTQQIRTKKIDVAVSYFTTSLASVGKADTLIRMKWKPQPPDPVVQAITVPLKDALEQMQKVQNLEINLTPKKTARPARLNQQIFRPDVWFSSPPKCNVLFPELYTQFSYGRNFTEEPTRFLLKTNDQFFGEDELFDHFYFAPKVADIKKSKALTFTSDLMDHELFCGIFPRFEKMGELNIMAARQGSKDPTLKKVGLAQRSANFLYFKYRFAARQTQVIGKFNPFVACGFPGLIIDRYVDMAALVSVTTAMQQTGMGDYRPDMSKGFVGTHFLGNFTEVTHQVDQQQGGTTVYNIGYARQHDESVEFLGSLASVQTVQKKTDNERLRSTDVAGIYPPRPGSIGPSGGTVSAVRDATGLYKTQEYANPNALQETSGDAYISTTMDMRLPVFVSQQQAAKGGEGLAGAPRVPIGVAKKAKDFGPEIPTLLELNPDRVIQFRAYRIDELVPQYRQTKVDLPAEEYIRPGWYGDVWHPANIGKAYQAFFRTGSITDTISVTDPRAGGGVDTSAPAAVQDAVADQVAATNGEDVRNYGGALLQLDAGSSIQQAVEFLVILYSYIRQSAGVDVDEFIRAYGWRPVATMLDMFGTSDLEMDETGTKVLNGIEGFHSRAFGPYDNLFGLVTPEIESIVGIKRGSTAAMKGDIRKRRHDAVMELANMIAFSKASLG